MPATRPGSGFVHAAKLPVRIAVRSAADFYPSSYVSLAGPAALTNTLVSGTLGESREFVFEVNAYSPQAEDGTVATADYSVTLSANFPEQPGGGGGNLSEPMRIYVVP